MSDQAPENQNQSYRAAPAPRKKSWGCFKFFLFLTIGGSMLISGVILLLLILGVIGLSGGVGGLNQPKYLEQVVENGRDGKIVIIKVHGVITSMDMIGSQPTSAALITQLRQAANDDDVAAIVLDMNTPGGEVIATDEIYHEMQKIRDAKGIQIVTCMRSVAASGGYYLACGSDWIVANRMTFTGSIGVIMGGYNLTELLDRWGIDPMVYKSGKMKDIMSMSRVPTEEEKAYLQEMIDTSFGEFAKIVCKGRNLNLEEFLASSNADGRVISGANALDARLIDQLGYMEDAIAKAKNLCGKPSAKVVRYKAQPTLADVFTSMQAPRTSLAQQLTGSYYPPLSKGHLYFVAPIVQ